jgi:hypothetical protein
MLKPGNSWFASLELHLTEFCVKTKILGSTSLWMRHIAVFPPAEIPISPAWSDLLNITIMDFLVELW